MVRAGLLVLAMLAQADGARAGQPGICDGVPSEPVDARSVAMAEVVVSASVLDDGVDSGDLVLGQVETLLGPHSDRWELGFMGLPPHVPPRVRRGDRLIFGIEYATPGEPGRGMLMQFPCRDNAVLPDNGETRGQLLPLLEVRK